MIQEWNGQPAVIPWTQEELTLIQNYRPRPAFAARDLALLETGLEDALIAADDSRLAYPHARPAPWKLDPRIKPALAPAPGSSYAPYQAAIAGAAEKILAYLFPAEPTRTFTAMANEAVQSRLWAGLNYRSDVEQARALGQKVASVVIAHGQADGHDATGVSEGPFIGEQYWIPTPPNYEGAVGGPVGKWKPLLMSSPSQLLGSIPPPSPYGSPAHLAQIKLVLDTSFALTDEQKQIANFWDDRPGTVTPPGHWVQIATELIKSYKTPGPQAARILALLGATVYDAAIAFFQAKYHYWQVRPLTAIWRLCDGGTKLCTDAEIAADPSRATYRNKWFSYIITPPFPSYPAGHPTFSGASAKLLGYFFPAAATSLTQLAGQAARSRLLGGIHYDEDNEAGLVMGRALADLAIQRASTDGAGSRPN